MALQLEPGNPRKLRYGVAMRHDLKLLEVDEGLLQELQRDGLCFKGAAEEEVVLCSASKTYALKAVETSNLVLLVPDNSYDADLLSPARCPQGDGNGVVGMATQRANDADAARRPPVVASAMVGSHLELVQSAPKLHALNRLLAQRQYGAEAEGEGRQQSDPGSTAAEDPAGSTWEELLCAVQASAAELRAALTERGAVCVAGRWRGVDPAYLGTLLEMLLLTAIEQGWSNGAIPAAGAAAALAENGYPTALTLHCLRWFGRQARDPGTAAGVADAREGSLGPMDEDDDENRGGGVGVGGEGVYELQEAAVCRHFARKLLAVQPRWDSRDAFLNAWTASVPEGMTPDLVMLRGEVLGDGDGAAGLCAFPASALPTDAIQRFAALFCHRHRWELPALQPYIEDLAGPGQTVEELLLRHARASQLRPADPVTYSAR